MEALSNRSGSLFLDNYSWSLSEIICFEGAKGHANKCRESFNRLKEHFSITHSLLCFAHGAFTIIEATPLFGHLIFIIEMIAANCFQNLVPENQNPPIALTREEAKTYYRTAYLCAKTALRNKMGTEEELKKRYTLPQCSEFLTQEEAREISPTLLIDKSSFFDPVTGLKLMIITGQAKAVLSFGMINPLDMEKELQNMETVSICTVFFKSLFANHSELHEEADLLVRKLLEKETLKGKEITVIGPCLFGSVAAYVGLQQNLIVETINTLPLQDSLINKIDPEKLQNCKNISNIVIEEDCVENPLIQGIINFANFILGKNAPTRLGQTYTVPHHPDFDKLCFFKKQSEIHQSVMKSFENYIFPPEETVQNKET